jgi:hypothetical protein
MPQKLTKERHQSGLADLAVKHYEKVLALAEEGQSRMDVDGEGGRDDFAKHAAYNLHMIYVTRDSPDLAREVMRRWL